MSNKVRLWVVFGGPGSGYSSAAGCRPEADYSNRICHMSHKQLERAGGIAGRDRALLRSALPQRRAPVSLHAPCALDDCARGHGLKHERNLHKGFLRGADVEVYAFQHIIN